MRLLVTGGAGFIGYHFVNYVLNNYSVSLVVIADNLNDYYSVNLKTDRLKELGFDFPSGAEIRYGQLYSAAKYDSLFFTKIDLHNRSSVQDIFTSYEFDVVIHLAAQAGVRYSIDNPGAYIDSNISAFYNILESCRAHNITKLLYASSSSVYGNNKKIPFSESDMTDQPVSLYAATKKANELMAYTYSHLYGITAIGMRFFTVYGPWGRPDMAYMKFINKIINNEEIELFASGNLKRDFTYIDDVVEGIRGLLEVLINNEISGSDVFNIGNNNPVGMEYFIEVLEKVLNKKAIIKNLPMQPGDVYETFADIAKLNKLIKFSPKISIEEGLSRFSAWYSDYMKLDIL